ncbi:MAG: CAP domain-containing protein [Methanobacteriaceae archaeon]|jgi:hypothetical protein|nr:CAP domain-containing protein [Candidatus Methanorudis spinitermitis]
MNIFKKHRLFQTLLLVLIIATPSFLFVEEVYANESSEVLKLVNKERAAYSLQPLIMDKELTKVAEIRCEEIKILFSHTRPDGTRGLDISPKANGENLAIGQKTPKEVVSAWMKSPSHRKQILNPNFTIIGISHKKTNTEYKNYWVQLFGKVKTKKVYLEKVSGVKVESKKNQITLKWKKQNPAIATGYEIYTYNSKTKKHKLLTKITKYNTNSLIISGLKSSTTYKYQIRSYKVFNKKVYYGSSSAITAKTK